MKKRTEPSKEIPIARTVDVAVAGAGISGVFAALAAAKEGASVLLIDRMGAVGGNIGPTGYVVGYLVDKDKGSHLPGNSLPCLVDEFMTRHKEYTKIEDWNYGTMSHASAQVAMEMADELGVELMLNAFASDPIVEDSNVSGLFVETKSGRVAVEAKVVIDATGDADLAARAGAPVRRFVPADEVDSPNIGEQYRDPNYKGMNDTNIYVVIAGSDFARFKKFREQSFELSKEMETWAREKLGAAAWSWLSAPAAIPIIKKCYEESGWLPRRSIRKNVEVGFHAKFHQLPAGLVGIHTVGWGEWDSGNWEDVTLVEAGQRRMAFEGVRFLREYIPGFERAHIVCTSQFMGSRGGPFIDAEYVLTPKETWEGIKLPDAMYISCVEVHRGANERGHDMPYRMILPKKIDHLLVTGRGAGFLRRGHDPSTRERSNMMALGNATGIAAAMSARDSIAPRNLDIKKLQLRLIEEGFVIGDAERLKELGLD